MLIECYLCVIFSTSIEQKSIFMSEDTLIFIIYQLFDNNLEILYNISSSMPFRGNFLAKSSLNFAKIGISVSMATMEATWLLGMFQLLILEGY